MTRGHISEGFRTYEKHGIKDTCGRDHFNLSVKLNHKFWISKGPGDGYYHF